MGPSDDQLPAVLARQRDIVATAGAGTGKTRTLVARYLSLLAEEQHPRGIIAITFTIKAAREMRNRVREEMRRYLEQQELDPAERARWRQLFNQLDAARIGTIHGLCTEILRAHPAEAQVDPRFDVLDEGQALLLQGQAVDQALAWTADDQGAVGLFSLLGDYKLRPTLATLLQQRLAVESSDQNITDPLAHWEERLQASQQNRLSVLLAGPCWQEAVTILRASRANKPDDRMEIQRQAALEAVLAQADSLNDRLNSLARLSEINLRGGSRNAWPGGKTELDLVRQALKCLRELWKKDAHLLNLQLNPLDRALAQAIPALRASWSFACRYYAELKRERNVLDFDDLEQQAWILLRTNVNVRDRWQEQIHAILVDEFQDTNHRQRDLVRILNGDQGKLFIVGDAKQSIYRFRGADVTVFRQERADIERDGGLAVSLHKSYRAHKALVESLNALLKPVLGEMEDPIRPWMEPFSPLSHHRENARYGQEAPFIELHLTVGSKSSGALDRAADALVGRIVELTTRTSRSSDRDGQVLNYGDVAILCRASNSFRHYEDALERANIPYLTVAGKGFYDRPEIRDLFNALQALVDPTDDLALVGMLRSPACALSDSTLYALFQKRKQDKRDDPLWNLLQEEGDRLAGDEGRKIERAVSIINDLNALAGRTTVAELLEAFLQRTDYRAALFQAGETRAARNVAKLVTDAHASGLVSVGEFGQYVTGLRDSGAREGEARATSEGAVQIMSVHAAKGLEFPLVAIGDISRKKRSQTGLLIDPDLGILLPLKEDDDRPAAYYLGKIQDEDQDAAESSRLLYVAATRTQEKLLLSGCISLSANGAPGRLGDWLGQLGGADGFNLSEERIDYDPEGDQAIALKLQAGNSPVACTIYEPDCSHTQAPGSKESIPDSTISFDPRLLEPISTGREEVDQRMADQERTPPRRVWQVVHGVEQAGVPPRVIGSLVHEALAAWYFPDDDFDTWVRARARGYGITNLAILDAACLQTRMLLERFQKDDLYQQMEGAERRLHELPYSLEVKGEIERGIIDAIFLHDQVWTIVEFKTDRLSDEDKFQRMPARKAYERQARRYALATQRLLGQRPRVILCMLNVASQVRKINVT